MGDYYKILQVLPNASEDEIRKAYRQSVKIYHPDNNPNNKEAEEKFRNITAAYEVLSDPQKRAEYDNGKTSSSTVKTTTNHTTPSSEDIIFNTLFGDDIKKFEKEKKEYLQFLKDMEPEFQKYNHTLEKEIKKVSSSTWNVIATESFYEKKEKIKRTLRELKENTKAFDNFLIFLEEIKKEAEQIGLNINNLNQYADSSQRGIKSAQFYEDLKNKIKVELKTIKENRNAFDKHLKFLKEMDRELNQYNMTINKIIEAHKGKKGQISNRKLEEERLFLQQQLSIIKRNAKAFDDFTEYYAQISQSVKELYSVKLRNFDEYLDTKNRATFAPPAYLEQKRLINKVINKLEMERKVKVNTLKLEIEKRKLNYVQLLIDRNLNESTISIENIKTILETLKHIDYINSILAPYNITLDDFLRLQGKKLSSIKDAELLVIQEILENFIKQKRPTNIIDFSKVNLNPEEKPKRLK